VAGRTFSNNFPGTAGGAQAVFGGNRDGFAARLSSALTALIQATYLGGSAVDRANALAIHPTTGDVYVAGHTTSDDVPATAGGAQPTLGSADGDAFVARLTLSLALVDPAAVAIPTLSPWALLAMAALLLMTGLVAVRRRWPSTSR
jgi:trans-2-enoyl-CoA reductase